MSESRIENLGVLFTAMLAVMVTGVIPLLPREVKRGAKRSLSGLPPETMELGKRIRGLRMATLRCKQADFAYTLGLSQSVVSDWERGKYIPSPMALMALGRLDSENTAWWFERARRQPAGRVEQPVGEAAEGGA